MPKKEMKLHTKIFIGLFAALVVGTMIQLTGMQESAKQYLSPILWTVGHLFLNALKMIVVPVVFLSLVCGIVGEGKLKNLGRMGARTVCFYLASTLLAIVTGSILVNLIRPGVGSNISLPEKAVVEVGQAKPWSQFIADIVPSNIFEALSAGNMISIIFFAVIFSVFTIKASESVRTHITGLLKSLLDVVMSMTLFIISLAPYGVFCLVAELIIDTGFDIFIPLALYFMTVLVGLSIHFCITLPVLFRVFTSLSPWKLMSAMAPSLLTAFSTASSSATLPLTLACAERRVGVSKRVSNFVLPLGATVNMDGTALYECVAAIFIAQALGFDLTLMQQFTVIITALMASVGAAGIPHAGLVMLVIIFDAVGLPLEAMGMIWGVDRILDMARTMTNVWSDSTCTAIVAHAEKDFDVAIFQGQNEDVSL